MKKTLLLLSAGLFCIGALSGCKGGSTTGSGEAVTLKFNFQPGTKYQYIMDSKQIIKQSPMGTEMTVNQDMTMQSTYEVNGDDNGNKKLTVFYDRVMMKTAAAGMNLEYDSQDSTKQDPMLKSLGGMINKPFSMTVTPSGEITKVEGLSEILNGMVDPSDPNAATIRQQLEGAFNDSAVRNMMQQSIYIYPDKPVKPGDTWTRKFSMNMGPFSMNMDNNFKLVSADGTTAHVELDSKITGNAVNNPQAQGMKIEMNGTQKGTMDLEIATGMITDSKMKQDIKGKINVNQMEMPISIASDIHITGKKK